MTEPKFGKKRDSIGKHFWDEVFEKADQQTKENFQTWQIAFDEAYKKTRAEPNRLFEYLELFPGTMPRGFYGAFINKTGRHIGYSRLYSTLLQTHSFISLDNRYCFCPNNQVDSRREGVKQRASEAMNRTKQDKKDVIDSIITRDLFSKLQIGGRVHWMQVMNLYNDKEINGSKVVMHERASKKLLLKLVSQSYLEEIKVEKEIWYKRIK